LRGGVRSFEFTEAARWRFARVAGRAFAHQSLRAAPANAPQIGATTSNRILDIASPRGGTKLRAPPPVRIVFLMHGIGLCVNQDCYAL